MFRARDGIEILDALAWFLSFANGDWIGPLLPVGFDESGRKLEIWRAWKMTHWRATDSWFPVTAAGQVDANGPIGVPLAELLPCFMERWSASLSNETLRTAIHWYIEAEHRAGGLEGAIILAQTALELMASAVVVEDKRLLSAQGLTSLPVFEQFRLLFGIASLPVTAKQMSEFETFLKSDSTWIDTPKALTEVRNVIIHSGKRSAQKINTVKQVLPQASEIYLWYLELMILYFTGYEGLYDNRLAANRGYWGPYHHVPWRRQPPA